jgi:hypothetical protein
MHFLNIKEERNEIDVVFSNIYNKLKELKVLKEPQKTQAQIAADNKEDEEQREKAKKNNDFVQLSRKNMLAFGDLIEENPLAAKVFLFMAKYADRHNALVVSSKVLEEYTGRGRTTVWKAVSLLEEKSFLSVGKSGSSNVYFLNPHLVWNSWRNAKDYCEFSGAILLSKSENIDLEEKLRKQINIKNML